MNKTRAPFSSFNSYFEYMYSAVDIITEQELNLTKALILASDLIPLC